MAGEDVVQTNRTAAHPRRRFTSAYVALLAATLITWILVLSPSPASPLGGLETPDIPDSDVASERLSSEPRAVFEAQAAESDDDPADREPQVIDTDAGTRETVLITPMDAESAADEAARPTTIELLSGAGILLLGILAGAVWLSLKGAAPHRKTIRDMRTNVG
ncbi:MAG: hypothetical protein KA110_09585 [Acidimicrobiia bacterium]|nr:hypothetical protein [Acidimicrobiia bacterium]